MKYFLLSFSITSLILICAFDQPSFCQEPYKITRIGQPINLDGFSKEPAWENVEPLPLFMYIPNYGGELTEKTEIRIAYDDNYLYASGRFYDSEPAKIQSTGLKRDDLKSSCDYFGLVIDSFNDNENSLVFMTSPAGIRSDMTVKNDFQSTRDLGFSWNTFWDVATKQNEAGWFVEMRIPFTSLRFQEINGDVIMGITVYRFIARKQERAVFPLMPQERGFYGFWTPSYTQEVIFENMIRKKPLYITPYLTGGLSQNYNLNDDNTTYLREDEFAREIGLDGKYGLTSNLTLDVTLNTDFAQVEADDQQVNLTRFSFFFPEKRLFFLERASNFEFSFGGYNQLFYSRRIGIHKGKAVPIIGGGRIVGRVGRWDVGFLCMQTAESEDLPSENFSVLRLRRQVMNPYSYVGAMLTSRRGTNGSYNTAYGLDGIFRLFGNDYLSFQWAQTFDDIIPDDTDAMEQVRLRTTWERRSEKGLGYDLNLTKSGRSYNPGIGFQTRHDYTKYGSEISYGWLPGKKSRLYLHQVFTDAAIYTRNDDGSIETSKIGTGYSFLTKMGYEGTFTLLRTFENLVKPFVLSENASVAHGDYTFYSFESQFNTPAGKLYDLGTTVIFGSFYDGRRVSVGLSPRWNIADRIELTADYEYNDVSFSQRNQSFNAHIARLKGTVMLSTSLSVSAFTQYNSANDVIINNVRLRYNLREGNDFYIVYDEGLNTDRARLIPSLPLTNNRTILLKYTYTFDIAI